MKKTFKTALSLLMALALVMSLAVTAFAQAAQPAADIVYQGEKKLVISEVMMEITIPIPTCSANSRASCPAII